MGKKIKKVKIIYPTDVRKYKGGHISKKRNRENIYKGVFNTRITDCIKGTSKYQYRPKSKTCRTYEEAFAFVKETAINNNGVIKNIIYDKGTHCECTLNRGQIMEFDHDDIDKVQKHLIYVDKDGSGNKDQWYAYAAIKEGKYRSVHFSNVVMDHDPTGSGMTIDHIKHDEKLNYRKSNLRIVTQRTQTINQKINKSNKSGIKGVYDNKGRKQWVAAWTDKEGKSCSKSFNYGTNGGYEKAREKAIAYRKKMVDELDHYACIRGR